MSWISNTNSQKIQGKWRHDFDKRWTIHCLTSCISSSGWSNHVRYGLLQSYNSEEYVSQILFTRLVVDTPRQFEEHKWMQLRRIKGIFNDYNS
jgi:hypothetical protein